MSTVSAVSKNYAVADTSASSAATALTGQKTLGQEDFLKLLAQQFQSQDPMKPMDDTSFIAQMAQFTSLQQTGEMSAAISALNQQQALATANSYLGHHVTVDTGDGETVSGDVSGIEMVDGSPRLVVGDYTYPVSAVILVEPAAITATSASSTNPSANNL